MVHFRHIALRYYTVIELVLHFFAVLYVLFAVVYG